MLLPEQPRTASVVPTALITIYATDAHTLEGVRRRLSLDVTAVPVSDWGVFAAVAADADCSIVCVPRAANESFWLRAERLRVTLPLVPLLALVPEDAPPTRVDRLGATGIVRDGEVALGSAVEAARTLALLRRAAAVVHDHAGIPSQLRGALTIAFERPRPPHSVLKLAEATGHHRHTLARQWSQRIRPSSMQLSDLVDWLLLARASIAYAQGTPWTAAADDLGIHRQTIAQLTERLLGERLADFSPPSHGRLRAVFEQNVLAPLLT